MADTTAELRITVFTILIFSVLTEFVQILISGRAFNYMDMIYNLSGIASSFLLVYVFIVRKYMRKKFIS